MEYHVERVELEEKPTAVIRGHVPADQIAQFLGTAYGEVMAVLAAQGLSPDGMPFGCYVPADGGMDIEAGFPSSAPVTPTGRVVASALPAGPAVQVMHRGAYDEVPSAYEAAESWLAANDWEASGPPWEAYLDDPEVAMPRTMVIVPCRPAGSANASA